MKLLLFALAAAISATAQAQEKGGSDVQSGGIQTKTLECYIAKNPQDATINLHDYEGGKITKSEQALILTLDIRKYDDTDTKFQHVEAQTRNLSFSTGAVVMRTEAGRRGQIECDGGGWDITLLNNGDMRISKVSAAGEVKDQSADEGCIGVGSIKASKPIELARVACRK